MRNVLAALAAAFCAASGAAMASPITVAPAPPGINESQLKLCVFGNPSLGCAQPYQLPTGSPGGSTTNQAHTFFVSDIRALFGDAFVIGIDSNTAPGSNFVQNLTKFALCLGASACPNSGNLYDLAQIYDIDAQVQGNGFTDYLMSVFDLAGLAGDQQITFTISLTGLTDGAEQFFLLDAPEVPLPAAAWMMLAGIGGLAAARRRKATV